MLLGGADEQRRARSVLDRTAASSGKYGFETSVQAPFKGAAALHSLRATAATNALSHEVSYRRSWNGSLQVLASKPANPFEHVLDILL